MGFGGLLSLNSIICVCVCAFACASIIFEETSKVAVEAADGMRARLRELENDKETLEEQVAKLNADVARLSAEKHVRLVAPAVVQRRPSLQAALIRCPARGLASVCLFPPAHYPAVSGSVCVKARVCACV